MRDFKGLFGVIGVDIVRENKKWLILEINPRFTSAYCGLKNSYNQETIDEITNFYLEGEFSNLVPKLLKKVKYIF
ncbi:MAG: ATP-grasp domain-containing protein [Alphaproteobacteria bacterium]